MMEDVKCPKCGHQFKHKCEYMDFSPLSLVIEDHPFDFKCKKCGKKGGATGGEPKCTCGAKGDDLEVEYLDKKWYLEVIK